MSSLFTRQSEHFEEGSCGFRPPDRCTWVLVLCLCCHLKANKERPKGEGSTSTPDFTSFRLRSWIYLKLAPIHTAHSTNTNTMICRRCHQLLLAHRQAARGIRTCSRQISQKAASRAQAVTAQTTQAPNPRPRDKPAATSTAAAQPFSTPPTPAQGGSDLPESGKQPAKVQSSVPAGTVLKGLNFLKNKQDPVALGDHEYPPWLWTVLNQRGDAAMSNAGDAEGDLFCA